MANSFPIRECYCPAHFGNSYEAMWPGEMAGYLAEMQHLGFNRYGDWLTTTDTRNPYTTDHWLLGRELLERKKLAYHAAQQLGLQLDLMVTANHVYLDQLQTDQLATPGPGFYGQLICPSQPAARAVILGNYENWFRDFAAAGIRLNSFTAFAYDYGGCGCDQCRPWILTFARLMREVHAIGEKYHPGLEPWFCSWWWKPEEHARFNDWAATEAPGWLKGMSLHIEYNQTRVKEVAVPAGCRKLAFVHIGYGDTNAGGDIYSKFGPVVAPQRIPATLHDLAAQGVTGYQAYSEGVFDDVNKALLAGTSLPEYARRYFGSADGWPAWLAQWGDRRQVDVAAAQTEFDRLAATARPGWRLEQWRAKLKLETLDRQIGNPPEWTPAKLKLVEQCLAEHEHLQRDVYRLGPLRHILAWPASGAAWYASWAQQQQATSRAAELPREA